MAIDHQRIQNQEKLDTFTKGIKTILIKEVEERIKQDIMPDIENTIKDLAIEAVHKWTIRMNTQKEHTGFDVITNVQVNFVEEVFNKIIKENVTNITVKGK